MESVQTASKIDTAVGSFLDPSVSAVSRMLKCSAEPGNKTNAAVNYRIVGNFRGRKLL